jgi:hypothetical protein
MLQLINNVNCTANNELEADVAEKIKQIYIEKE